MKEEMEAKMRKALEGIDLNEWAKAWHEGDIKWHAEEWKAFIEQIKASEHARIRQRLIELNKDKHSNIGEHIDVSWDEADCYNQALADVAKILE